MLNNSNPDNFKVKSIHDIKNEAKRNKKIRVNKKKQGIVFMMLLLCISILAISMVNMEKKICLITVNGNQIGVVEKNEDLIKLKEKLIEEFIKESGAEDVRINEEIKTEKIKAKNNELTPETKLLKNLQTNLTYKVKAYTLVIEEIERVVLETPNDINSILNEIKNMYDEEGNAIDFARDPELIKEYFVNDVKIDNRYVDKKDIMTLEEAKEILLEVQTEEKYTVKSKDTLWTIAQAHNLELDEIVSANAGFTADTTLKVGTKINLIVARPLLSVYHSTVQTYNSTIERPVEKINRDDKYEDYSKTITEGKDGVKKTTVKIVMINGVEERRETISEEEVEKAESKVIEIGTMKLPPKPTKGLFINPTKGTFTSLFGEVRGSSIHKGLDIANSIGTPIYASYSGTITYASTQNGFGNVIYIKHSNGYETVYGHLNEILVKNGTQVKKGDLIAKMGNTGNSTGPHLHFEIRKDGVATNPLNYIQ